MRKDGGRMLLWEELPSAQAPETQAIFLYEERCRLAGNLVQASAKQATQLFAFRPAPGGAMPTSTEQIALIALDMTAGLRLIYTSAPFRLRHISARSQENNGLLPRQVRTARLQPTLQPLTAWVRLLLRQARRDTSRLVDTLAQLEEPSFGLDSSAAAGTGVWRLGVALSALLQSGQDSSIENLLERSSRQEPSSDTLAAFALARSIVRPSDWSSRAPLKLSDLSVISGEVDEHFTGSVRRIVAEMQHIGMDESVIKSALDQRRVPPWLLSRVFRDNPSPWRKE